MSSPSGGGTSAPKPAAKPAAKPASGGGGFPQAARSVGSRGVSYVTASGARQTAFLLIVAILLARLVLTNQLQTFWAALWGPTKPLGSAIPARQAQSGTGAKPTGPATGGGGSAGSF